MCLFLLQLTVHLAIVINKVESQYMQICHMNLYKIISFILFVSIEMISAQTNFKPAYVITNPGDTIYGEVDSRRDMFMSSVCRFKDADDVITDYSPHTIMAYRFIDSKYYVSREVDNKNVFLEYLINGEINMYYMSDETGDHYYLDKDGVRLTEIVYGKGEKIIDGREVVLQSTKHMGLLFYYMHDAPELKSKIEDIEVPNHESLIKIAEEYHEAVCDGEKCIVYKKKEPSFQISLELLGGSVNYTGLDDVSGQFTFQTGLVGHIWMPSTNEKMYFKTGVVFSPFGSSDELDNSFKIPLHLEYIYPKGLIRPRLSYGANLYLPFYHSVSCELGANVELGESLFLSVTSEIESDAAFLIVPNGLLSYSFRLGLFKKF